MKAQILIILTSVLLGSTPLEEIQNKWMTLKPDGTRWNLTDLGKLCAEYSPMKDYKIHWTAYWAIPDYPTPKVFWGQFTLPDKLPEATRVTTSVFNETYRNGWRVESLKVVTVTELFFEPVKVQVRTPPPIQPVVDPNDPGLKLLRELLKERP